MMWLSGFLILVNILVWFGVFRSFPLGGGGGGGGVAAKVTFVDQDRKSKLDEVHYLIIRDVECKVLSKTP